MRVYLDIETIPGGEAIDHMSLTPPKNMSKKETIDKWFQEKAPIEAENQYRKRALNPLEGNILCIGFAFNDEEPVSLTGNNLCQKFYDEIQNALQERFQGVYPGSIEFIGFNIREFDIPFLRMHSIKERSKLHSLLPQRKFDPNLSDLVDYFTTSSNRYVSQDSVCSFLGIEGKGDDIDGSKVYDYYLADKIPEIAEYCSRDVETVRLIHKIVNG